MITFFNELSTDAFTVSPEINEVLKRICKDHDRRLEELNIILVEDKELKRISSEYLNQDHYTDVISFDLSDSEDSLLGEIYVAPEMVKSNAVEAGASFSVEFHRVLIHGLLHLCGYTDKDDKKAMIMRAKEDEYIQYVPRETM